MDPLRAWRRSPWCGLDGDYGTRDRPSYSRRRRTRGAPSWWPCPARGGGGCRAQARPRRPTSAEMQGGRDVHGLDCKDWMQTNAHEERCKPGHDLKRVLPL
ncbi:uncharacterized protein LOC119273496 isoform X2 [Triticum dicoccoides]|uniref:uncharacterized protein LOC119273496 isoform X2 n=1 Tax=Triticum dicoccoides TaxID=85692 RepID=UPI00188FC9BE|nr:uncharacterized protein LOC119273496 isoform X2 [Triticum dicoccoides]